MSHTWFNEACSSPVDKPRQNQSQAYRVIDSETDECFKNIIFSNNSSKEKTMLQMYKPQNVYNHSSTEGSSKHLLFTLNTSLFI